MVVVDRHIRLFKKEFMYVCMYVCRSFGVYFKEGAGDECAAAVAILLFGNTDTILPGGYAGEEMYVCMYVCMYVLLYYRVKQKNNFHCFLAHSILR